jgi:pyruvate,water dikinase
MLNFLWFRDCYYSNIHLVGGKSASLGELSRLPSVNSADGFAVTTKCYDQFLEFNHIKSLIDKHHEKINNNMSISELNEVSKTIQRLFKITSFPAAIEAEMLLMFEQLPTNIELAVRSSAIAEDLPHASFAGQQDTYLNITSFCDLKRAIIDCFASLFNANAISYRSSNQIHYDQIKMAVCVQKMVRSDLGTAGVAFSLDPETGYSKAVVINSSYGLGEAVVGGQVNPDEFIVDKRVCGTLDKTCDPILSKKLGQKSEKIVFKPEGTGIEVVPTTPQEEKDYSLTNFQIREIAETVLQLEEHYQNLHEKKLGVDIEWAYDGKDRKLYILQIRVVPIKHFCVKELLLANKSRQARLCILNLYLILRLHPFLMGIFC